MEHLDYATRLGERREQIYRSAPLLLGRSAQRADNHCQHEFDFSRSENAVNKILPSGGRWVYLGGGGGGGLSRCGETGCAARRWAEKIFAAGRISALSGPLWPAAPTIPADLLFLQPDLLR